MKIENVGVYGLDEAVQASGLPMLAEDSGYKQSYARAKKLGSCRPGSGHDCYLKGILVAADITAPQYWWLQFQRYHFADIVSSQSKMHRLFQMDLDTQLSPGVTQAAKEALIEAMEAYHEGGMAYSDMMANVPMGLMLKARITTNYLQLKTMHQQRKSHKLQEWQVFCDWIVSLPRFSMFTNKKEVQS